MSGEQTISERIEAELARHWVAMLDGGCRCGWRWDQIEVGPNLGPRIIAAYRAHVTAALLAAGILQEVEALPLQRRLYDGEKSAGWDPDDANTLAEEIAHLHEEISEAFRAYRQHKDSAARWTCERCGRSVPFGTDLDSIRHPKSGAHYTSRGADNRIDGGGMDCRGRFKPTGVPIELADAAIGMFYIAERWGFDLLDAIEVKHRYNLTRSYADEGRRLHDRADSIVQGRRDGGAT